MLGVSGLLGLLVVPVVAGFVSLSIVMEALGMWFLLYLTFPSNVNYGCPTYF